MSLVNQMLKDLEARRAQLPQGDSLRGLHAAPASVPRASRWPLIMLLSVASGGAFGWWLSQPAAPLPALPVPMARADRDLPVRNVAVEAGPAVTETGAAAPEPTAVRSEPAIPLGALETPAPAAPAKPALKPAPPPDGKPVPRPQSATALANAADTAQTPGVMHKTPRPLDPQQQAARHYAGALEALRGGDAGEAETALRAALDLLPGHGDSARTLATLLVQQGRHGEAETVLSAALAIDARQPALRTLYARLLAERGSDVDAVALLQGVTDPEALALLGALQQRLGNDVEAAAAYRQAVQRAPQKGAWWLGLAISLERTRQPSAALEAYRRALRDAALDAQVNDYVRGRIAALGNGQG